MALTDLPEYDDASTPISNNSLSVKLRTPFLLFGTIVAVAALAITLVSRYGTASTPTSETEINTVVHETTASESTQTRPQSQPVAPLPTENPLQPPATTWETVLPEPENPYIAPTLPPRSPWAPVPVPTATQPSAEPPATSPEEITPTSPFPTPDDSHTDSRDEGPGLPDITWPGDGGGLPGAPGHWPWPEGQNPTSTPATSSPERQPAAAEQNPTATPTATPAQTSTAR